MASAGGEQLRTGDYNMEVYVTHVKLHRELGQVNFWGQLNPEGAEQLEELDVLIQDKANADPYPPEPKSLLVGEPCLALFIEDSRWYRARVEQCTENDVIAYFIDYGNTEIVPFNLIRRADSSVFADLKPQATECILEGVKITEKSGVLSYIKKLMNDQSFLGKPAGFVAGRAHMTLQMDTESRELVADRIIRDGFGSPMRVRMPSGSGGGPAGGGSGDRKVQFRNMGLDKGSREKLFISHVESPSSFWIQQSCISLDLDNLMNDLTQFYSEGPGGQVVRRAEDGMLCVALFSEDEAFYRAVVDKVLANNQCRVLFVDYGNKEVTAVSNLRVITDEFMKLPTIAIRCCLSGIEEASCTSAEATERFEELTGEKELCGKVVGFKADKCAILLVDPNGKENADIAGVLVKEGLAKRDQEQFPMKGSRRTSERTGRASPVSSTSSTASIPQQVAPSRGRLRSDEMRREPQGPTAFTTPSLRSGSKNQVQVTSVESLTSFSCQMLKDTEEFDDMMSSLQDAYASPPPDSRLTSPNVNQPCCAQFTEDDSWYRAQITATRGSDYHVTYVDYGNNEVISGSRLRVLKSQFFQLPLQCISCTLDGINPQDANAPKARDHLEAITSEKTLIATIASIRHDGSGNVYGVVLTEEGTNFNINKEMQQFLQSSRTPPRDNFQSSQPSRPSGRDSFQNAQPAKTTPPRRQQQQGGFQQRTPPRDQFQKNVKSPPRTESQFGQDRSTQGFGQAAPAKQAPSPGRAPAQAPVSAPAEPITFTEVQLPNGALQVYLSHGNSPAEFWCQPVKSGSELDALMEKIHSKYSGKSAPPSLKSIAVGTPCIAQFSEDQGWYRAVVINKHVGELEVLFVDYGNAERVTMTKVKQISPDLMKLPAQAVKCALKGWNLGQALPKVINKMRELANTVEQFKCDSHGNSGGVYEVELSWGRVMKMGQELIKLQTQALKEKKQKETSAPPKPTQQPASPARTGLMIGSAIDSIKVDAHEDFIISHVDNPGRFWCQLAKSCGTLDEIMIKLNDHYTSSSGDALESVLGGTFCVAKYTQDDGWYRAQVLKTISVSQVEVHFIDYGNNDQVDVSNLRKIRPEFTKLKSQAVQCALVEHTDEKYEQDLITKFEELIMEKQLVGDVKAKRAGMLVLQLFDTSGDHDININQEVKSMMGSDVVGYPPQVDLPNECEVYTTHIEGPHQFFIQMSSQTEAIENMSAKLQDAYLSIGPSQLVLPRSKVGQACCAKFSEDEQWYRAVVIHKPSTARAKVRFIDFGNSEEQDVSQLKTLKPEFLDQVPLAVECRLGKCMKNVPGTLEKLEELMMDKPLMCSFHGNATAPFGVTVKDGDTDVNEEMSGVVGAAATKIASDEDSASPYPWPSLSKDCVEVSLTHASNPWDFWCQLTTQELNQLTNSLQNAYAERGDNTESDVLPGSACICQSEDGTWYRGEVISAPSEDQSHVLFVDTGVTETVSRSKVWPIEDNFLSVPRQAIHCKMSTVKPCSPDWDETSIDAFKKMAAGCNLIAEVLGIDRGGSGQDTCYRILLRSREGALISDMLTERRLAEQVDVDTTQQIMPKTSEWKGKTYPRENLTPTKQDVRVVRGDSPSKFFVKPLHFLAMVEDLEREIEAFTEGILGNLVLPDWLPTAEIGMPCLAMRKDTQKWCRAEVQSVLPKGGIIVSLVDEGMQQYVFPSDLRPINAKLVDMPATVVECKLKDVAPMKGNFWDESVCEVFKEMVLDQEVEITVDEEGADLFKEEEGSEEEKKSISETLKEMGLAREPGTEEEEEEDVVDPDAEVALYFLSITGPTELICQPAASAEKLQELMDSISEFYSDESNQGGLTPEVGLQCIAKFTEDDSWYRATIESIHGTDITVRYTDYGNSEVVTEDRLCNLQPQFAKLRAQARSFQVTPPLIEETKWSGDLKTHLEGCLAERELKVNILDTSGEYPTIRLSPEDATFIQASVDTLPTAAPVAAVPPATVAETGVREQGAAISLIFLSAEGPSTLICQPVSTADDLAMLMDNIANHYEDEANQAAFTPVVGQQCIARFTEDDGLYRAEVKAVDDGSIIVKYIDYGNSEALTSDRLFPIQAEFTQLTAQAVSYEVAPPLMHSSQWNDDLKALLDESCAERELKGYLIASDVATIKLCDGDVTFINTLLGDNLPPVAEAAAAAAADTILELGEAISLIFLSADGSSTFTCQPVSTADDLATLMDNIAVHYEDEANQAAFTPVVGQQCIARFTEDEGLYRAEVKAIGDGSITVRYIDYGNSEALSTDRLCSIKAEFTQLQPQAITYKVAPPLMHSSQWSDDVKALLDESCAERELKGNLLLESGDVPTVKLSDEDTTFIKTALGDSLPPVVETGKTEEILELGEAINLMFLSADGHSSFCCQPTSTADALATLMDEMATFYEEADGAKFAPEVGQQCIAQFTEDDGWYRAQVQEINDDDFVVKYVDYGNTETLQDDRLREIQPQFQELANQAIIYRIKPDLMHPSQWNDDVKGMLDESCAETELKGHLVKTSDASLAVKLSKEDEDFIKSSVASILPPVVEAAASIKDAVDDIVEALVNTAITDALDEMTAPASIQQAAGVTVMTLFDKVAECLLKDELQKDDVGVKGEAQDGTSELEEDTMTGVKKLVDDIVKKAVETVTGEKQQEEEADLPHQILDEIIETVAGSLHISSAAKALEEREGDKVVSPDDGEGDHIELPSPQRKRNKSGEGLPGMEGDANDCAVIEETTAEGSKEAGEPDVKKPKIKEGETEISEEEKGQEVEEQEQEGEVEQEMGEQDQDDEEQDQEEGNESTENFEDAEDNVVAENETGDGPEEQSEQDEVPATATEPTEEKAESETPPDEADEGSSPEETKEDQDESFESAPSTPERESTSETTPPEGGGDAVNGDTAVENIHVVGSEEANDNDVNETGDSNGDKSEHEKSSGTVSDKATGDKAGDIVDEVVETEEATEG